MPCPKGDRATRSTNYINVFSHHLYHGKPNKMGQYHHLEGSFSYAWTRQHMTNESRTYETKCEPQRKIPCTQLSSCEYLMRFMRYPTSHRCHIQCARARRCWRVASSQYRRSRSLADYQPRSLLSSPIIADKCPKTIQRNEITNSVVPANVYESFS